MSSNVKRPIIKYSNVALIQSDSPCHATAANSGDSLSFVPLVNAISFSFDLNRSQEGGLGSKNLLANSNWRPADVNFNVSKNEDFGNLFSNLMTEGAILNNFDNDRNFYVLVHDEEKKDILNIEYDITQADVLSFGNCFLNNISLSQSVGGFLTSEYSFMGSNMQAQKLSSFTTGQYFGGSGIAPSFNLTGDQSQNVPVVFNKIPGDSPETFASGFFGETGRLITNEGTSIILSNNNTIARIDSVQNFTLNFPIPRKSIYGIGKQNSFIRKSIFPSTASFNMTSIVSNFSTTGKASNLKEFLTKDENYQITLTFQNLQNKSQNFIIQNAKLMNNNYSLGIGELLTCDLDFTFGINNFRKSGDGIV